MPWRAVRRSEIAEKAENRSVTLRFLFALSAPASVPVILSEAKNLKGPLVQRGLSGEQPDWGIDTAACRDFAPSRWNFVDFPAQSLRAAFGRPTSLYTREALVRCKPADIILRTAKNLNLDALTDLTLFFRGPYPRRGERGHLWPGSCERTTAVNTSPQPSSSGRVMVSPRSHQPPRVANTDSRLIMRDALVGSRCFCPRICKE